MIPVFGDENRRKINLGGASSATSHQAILDQARAERNERQKLKRKQESAVKLQAWWRGIQEAQVARKEMRGMFDEDVTGITGLRCLVLIGQDEEIIGRWSSAVMQGGEDQFLSAFTVYQNSWLVLIRQASLLLLRSVAQSPQSPNAQLHLQVLSILLSSTTTKRVLGSTGTEICVNITQYLINHNLYDLLSQAIRSIPVEAKNSPALPLIVNLVTSPFTTFTPTSPQFTQCLCLTFVSILTILQLPNRLPIDSLPRLISRIPFANLDLLEPHIPTLVDSLSTEAKVHLAVNIHMFFSPHYQKYTGKPLATYLRLFSRLFGALPVSVFDRPEDRAAHAASTWARDDEDSDNEDGPIARVSAVMDFNSRPQEPLPQLDAKTLQRAAKIPSTAHITSLLKVTQSSPVARIALISFLLALNNVWPSHKDRVLSTVLVLAGGGLVRELYREHVRRSPIGKDENSGALMDPANASSWSPLLFLTDLYTQALLTMGDDEFFGTATNTSAPRNPFTLDELRSFSRQLLNIAFALYWRDDQTHVQEAGIAGDVQCTWELVREKITKCLLAIHARDSRRSFTPPDHWLVTSQIDVQSFVEAAVFEEQQLSKTDDILPRMLSKRQIAGMSPRLGVLNNIPFAIPFEVRVSIFRHFVMNDMMARGVTRHPMFIHQKTRVQVRRGSVAQDGFDRLTDVDLHSPIEITFIDQFGQEEAGIDGGGVFKEFFTSLCKEVFDTDRGLWLANKKNELYPNPHAYASEPHSLNWYRFIGRILGKAMYEGILVDVAFAGFFLAKWLGKQSFLDDLASLDPELYNGLIFLKHYPGNPEELSLNFTVAIDEFGVTRTIDLIPNGSSISVTRENRLHYIYLVSHYRLSKQIKLQSEAFFEGLSEIIDPKWLRMFNQQEVQVLLGGVNAPIDLDDLRQHTNYGGLYDNNEPTIVAFWKVVNTFDQEQRRALLRFVTSCSRPPLLGFKELVPNFSIRDAGSDQDRLPTSSTCVNLLKLPRYPNERKLREKLLQAIMSGAGFDLS
ncbi:HECT-domain-containing protein [Crucibulum laeve]|uniref:HECT-type E3 ubiquitin transferase n=1 Tax=Crucibulum laeve TaxID=68775 RepID=A0A5C3LJA8_9AGAR|nr:HECT-domain-containing protein [Crucibulum laeve]